MLRAAFVIARPKRQETSHATGTQSARQGTEVIDTVL